MLLINPEKNYCISTTLCIVKLVYCKYGLKQFTLSLRKYFAIITLINMILNGVNMKTPWKIPIVIDVSQQKLFTRPIFKPYKMIKNDVIVQNKAQQVLKNMFRNF